MDKKYLTVNNMFYFEVSARSRSRIDDAFEFIVEKAMMYDELNSLDLLEPRIVLSDIEAKLDIPLIDENKNDHVIQSCPCLVL